MVGKILGNVAWLVTALASINLWLNRWGYDFFRTDLMQIKMPWLQAPLYCIIGIAGILSLVMFVMSLTKSGCQCPECKK
jgi:uncharacterized membrane protein YuzA (DUF378 family)